MQKDDFRCRRDFKEIPIIKEIANEKKLSIIDANTTFLSHCDHFADGIHPNQKGADTIASVISRSIKPTTHAVIDIAVSASKQEVRGVYSVFNRNTSSVFTELLPGVHYEVAVFNINGVLIGKSIVNTSITSPSSINSLFSQTNTMRLLTVKKLNSKGLR